MTAKRSRATQRKGKRRRFQSNFLGLISLLALLIFAGCLALASGIHHNHSTVKPTTSQQTSTSTQTTSSSTTASSDTSTDSELTWEKQESPVKLPILMYHAVHVMAEEESANANLIVDPATFEEQLKSLQDAGYYAVTPEEAYKILTENVLPQGKKVVWLTFDDSLWDFHDIAYPILKKYNMHATNNVITGTVGNQGNLSLEQMVEMKQNGMSFQSHTVNHPDLEYTDVAVQKTELTDSKAYLDSNLNQDTIAVAYPAGRYSADTLSLVEQANYKLGMTTNEGLASASDGLLSLNRVRILPTTTADVLLNAIATN